LGVDLSIAVGLLMGKNGLGMLGELMDLLIDCQVDGKRVDSDKSSLLKSSAGALIVGSV